MRVRDDLLYQTKICSVSKAQRVAISAILISATLVVTSSGSEELA